MKLTAFLGVPLTGTCLLTLALTGSVARQFTPLAQDQPAVQVFANDGGEPLFTARDMRPGQTRTACVDVTVNNASTGDTVGFGGEQIGGPLANLLQLTVQAGPTVAGDCTSFTGIKVYSGTLSALATTAAATGWYPANGQSTWRFRFDVTALPQAEPSSSATAAFDWHFSSAPLVGTTAIPSVTSTGTPSTSTLPTTTPPTAGHHKPNATIKSEPNAGVVLTKKNPSWAVEALTTIGDIAKALLRHPQYPIALGILALLFMLAQTVADRRDPKLALAPMRNDDLRFAPSPADVVLRAVRVMKRGAAPVRTPLGRKS